jgi:UDP-glucose 4-epimerase
MHSGVLVVGGGFLGSHVAGALAGHGHPTTVLTRTPPTPMTEARIGDAAVRIGDAADTNVFTDSLEGANHVVWCAGGLLPADSNEHPAADVASALLPLLSALDILRHRRGVGITFFSSGGTVYGNPRSLPVNESHPTRPLTSYGVTKVAAEQYLSLYGEVYGVPHVVLRCGNVYGEGQPTDRSQGLIAAALECTRIGRPLAVYGDGLSVRDFVFIDDVVGVVAALLGRSDPPPVLNVGSGGGASVANVLALVERVTGETLELQWRPVRPGDVRQIVLDISRLRSVLPDYEPTSLVDGVALMWAQIERTERAPR